MLNYDLAKGNRAKNLAIVLVLSLLANFYLVVELGKYSNSRALIRDNQYLNYFNTLLLYGKTLDCLISAEAKDNDVLIERELQTLNAHSLNLVEYARTYRALSKSEDNELSNLIWDLAIHIRNMSVNLNKAEIENARNSIEDFSRAVNGIVKLENGTRLEVLESDKGLAKNEVHDVISPLVKKAMELPLFGPS